MAVAEILQCTRCLPLLVHTYYLILGVFFPAMISVPFQNLSYLSPLGAPQWLTAKSTRRTLQIVAFFIPAYPVAGTVGWAWKRSRRDHASGAMRVMALRGKYGGWPWLLRDFRMHRNYKSEKAPRAVWCSVR